MRCPASTASTIVTELRIRIMVIRATKPKGTLASPMPGKALNTWSGMGHQRVLNTKFSASPVNTSCLWRIMPYVVRNAAKVKASDSRKNHIISLP